MAVEAITTASYATWPSECRPQGNYIDAVIDTLNLEDIACPTWGLSDPFYTTCDGDVYLTATEGPPYNPVILVPTQFLNYDPLWGSCTKIPSNGPFLLPCGVYDPPRALHAASAMAPPTTPASNPPGTTPPPAEPEVAASPKVTQAPQTVKAQVPQPVQPEAVNNPANSMFMQGLTHTNGDPQSGQSQDPANTSGTNNDPAKAPSNQDPPQGQGNSNPNPAPAASPNQDPSKSKGNSNGDPGTAPNQPPSSNAGGSSNGGSSNGGASNGASNNGGSSNGASNNGGSNNVGSNNGQSSGSSGSGGSTNSGTNNGIPGPNDQPASPQNSPAVGPQEAAPAPQPVPQTTINIGGSQPSQALGGIINGALGGSPTPAGQPNSGNSGQGGVNSGSGSEGGQQGGNSGSGSGNGPGGSSSGSSEGGSSSGSVGGANGGSPGSSPGGNPGGNSEGSQSGSGTSSNNGGAPGGTSGGSSGASPNNPGQIGGNSGVDQGGSPEGSQSGNQGGNPQPNAPFTPHAITALGQTLNAVNPSAVAIAGNTLSAGGPAFSSNGNFFSVGPSGNLVAGTLAPGVAAVATPAPVLTFGGSAFTANSASQFVIAGQTLAAGAQITVSGTPISLPSGSSNVAVIGSSTQTLSMVTPPPVQGPVLSFGGSTYAANGASQFIIAGQTLTPGAQITVSGTPISMAPGSSNVAVVGGSTQSLAIITPGPSQGPAVLTFGGSTYSANAASQFVIAGQTLTPGGAITISGTPISLPPTGAASAFAVVGTSTQTLGHAAAAAQSPALLTFDGSTYTANSASQFVIAGKTLTPGGQITVFGMPVSEDSGGSFAVVGGKTQSLITPGATQAPALLTFGGQTYTANSASDFIINGQTLTPGGQITISGTPISEAPSGSGLVAIGSSTQVLGHAPAGVTNAAVMTFGGQTFTADSASDFVIDGQTLTPGGMITVSGTPISEAAGATDVVIGTSTEALSTVAITSSAMAFEGAGIVIGTPKSIWLLGWMSIVFASGLLFLA